MKRIALIASLLGLVLLSPEGHAQNLIPNGGFNESGEGVWDIGYPNAYFTSQYLARPKYNDPGGYLGGEGTYSISTDPALNHGGNNPFRHLDSDQGGDGYMMVVNGASQSGVTIWQGAPISIEAGTTYRFSGYVTNVNTDEGWSAWRSTQAILSASISLDGGGSWRSFGEVVNLTLTHDPKDPERPINPNDWNLFSVEWSNTTSTSVILRLQNVQTAVGGNDFALDSLSLVALPPAQVPEPAPIALILGGGLGILLYRGRHRARRTLG